MRPPFVLCYIVATLCVAAPSLAQRVLDDEQTSSLLQYVPAVVGSQAWQVTRVAEAYDWQQPDTVNADVVFPPSAAGPGECLAPIFAFERRSDAPPATQWQISDRYARQYYYWPNRERCDNLALTDGVLLRDRLDSGTLRFIWQQTPKLVDAARIERRCSTSSTVHIRQVGLDQDGQNGMFYDVMLDVGDCGALSVRFHLFGDAIEIIDTSWVAD